jgi:hypothetical protein
MTAIASSIEADGVILTSAALRALVTRHAGRVGRFRDWRGGGFFLERLADARGAATTDFTTGWMGIPGNGLFVSVLSFAARCGFRAWAAADIFPLRDVQAEPCLKEENPPTRGADRWHLVRTVGGRRSNTALRKRSGYGREGHRSDLNGFPNRIVPSESTDEIVGSKAPFFSVRKRTYRMLGRYCDGPV